MADVEKKVETVAVSSPTSLDIDVGSIRKRNKLVEALKGHVTDPNEYGRQLFEQALQYDEAQLERDAKIVKRKLDFMILPLMCGTYMVSFLDKQTLNYSNTYGLQADTNMTGSDYSWVASALNIGWLVAAYPWNFALQRYPIGRLIGCMLFVWGAICMCQAAVFNFSGFFAIRFFLGALEACISPAFILLTSMFWTQSEQSLRSSFWLACNGFSSIIGALLAYGSGNVTNLAIPNWKLIYLIVGCITIAWGFVIVYWLPDGPHNAKQLSEYERQVAVWRVSKNRIGLKHKEIKPYQIKEACMDPKVHLMLLMGAAVGILNGGVANFTSALIKGFGFEPLQASLMQTPGGAFEIIGCILFGFLSVWKKNLLGITIILACLPGLAGLIGILTIPESQRYALVGMAWMQNVLGSPLILNWTLPGLNIAGDTKRAATLGMYFVFYCAGNIAGPHLFLADEVPRYPTAIKGLLGSYAALIVFQALYTTLCFLENKRRDRAGLHVNEKEEEREGFDDLTDWENKHFRYVV